MIEVDAKIMGLKIANGFKIAADAFLFILSMNLI